MALALGQLNPINKKEAIKVFFLSIRALKMIFKLWFLTLVLKFDCKIIQNITPIICGGNKVLHA